jgi:DNA-binding NarL/FixJ family response regulator
MSETIYIQIDNEKMEATGEVLEQILKDRAEAELAESARLAKIAARESALAKLAALGLTEEEIAAL